MCLCTHTRGRTFSDGLCCALPPQGDEDISRFFKRAAVRDFKLDASKIKAARERQAEEEEEEEEDEEEEEEDEGEEEEEEEEDGREDGSEEEGDADASQLPSTGKRQEAGGSRARQSQGKRVRVHP